MMVASLNTQNSTKNSRRRAEEKEKTYPQIKKQHLRFTNIPTDEKNQHLRRNPQKQKNNISDLPTFPRTKKINISEETLKNKKTTSQIYQHSHGRKKSTSQKKPSKTKEQHQQQINQTHNRAGCVIFYTLVPFLKFHSKTTTTNRDWNQLC